MSGSRTGTPVSRDPVGLKPADYVNAQSLRLSPARDYRLIRSGAEEASLNLFAAPQGQVLVTAATRVDHFGSTADTLPALGLPSRMKNCLVYYTCWQLLTQRLAIGQEELRLMSRQTESGTEDRSEILAGLQTQTQVEDKSQLQGLSKEGTTTEDKNSTQSQERATTQTDTKDGTVSTAEDSTTTEDKTPTVTGTRDSTTTETKAALAQEDTNLEQTEDKNATALSASAEVVAEERSAATTGGDTQSTVEGNTQTLHSTSDETTRASKQSETETGTTEEYYDVKTGEAGTHDVVSKRGNIGTTTNERGTASWDRTTPAVQTGSTAHTGQVVDDNTVTTNNQSSATLDKNSGDKATEGLEMNIELDTTSDHIAKTETQSADNASTTTTDKDEKTSEDNTSSTTADKTDTSVESNLVLNLQEKVATNAEDNVTIFSEVTTEGTAEDNVVLVDKDIVVTTDEDDVSVVAETVDVTGTEDNIIGVLETSDQTTTEDNTITTDQSTDNTTTSVFTTTKVTGVESRDTYRDRFQTAQYYKMLLDLEVNAKKMRSWAARGL